MRLADDLGGGVEHARRTESIKGVVVQDARDVVDGDGAEGEPGSRVEVNAHVAADLYVEAVGGIDRIDDQVEGEGGRGGHFDAGVDVAAGDGVQNNQVDYARGGAVDGGGLARAQEKQQRGHQG